MSLFIARMFPGPAGTPPRVDRTRQAALLREHREQVLARTEYLDGLAAHFRFDHPLDADLPGKVRHGIERRLARVRELAAAVRGYAARGVWPQAWTHYEMAEQVAANADHWLARGRAEAAALQAARQRERAARKGGKAKQSGAEASRQAFASACLDAALQYRRLHPEAPLSAVIAHLRRLRDLDESDITIRRYLTSLGLK